MTIFLLVPGICPQATGLKIHRSRISGVRSVTDLSAPQTHPLAVMLKSSSETAISLLFGGGKK